MKLNHNRRDIVLTTSKTGEVLPEYFQDDNSTLITFLDKYYEFLDSDGQHAFSNTIRDVIHARDTAETDTDYLDELIKEIGNGLEASTFFQNPRLMAKLLGAFYRAKGTIVSAEGFFRGFFNEEVTIEYPKNSLFIVGESNIGYDSQKFITDNAIYQTFSVLVKVGLSTQDYETLYKKFVHPAGFHFAGQVALANDAVIPLTTIGLNPLDSADLATVLSSETILGIGTSPTQLTGLFDSEGIGIRFDIGQGVITDVQTLLPGTLDKFYPSISRFLNTNSFTFDDSSASSRPDFSMDLETMDNDMFTRYTSDSSF